MPWMDLRGAFPTPAVADAFFWEKFVLEGKGFVISELRP